MDYFRGERQEGISAVFFGCRRFAAARKTAEIRCVISEL